MATETTNPTPTTTSRGAPPVPVPASAPVHPQLQLVPGPPPPVWCSGPPMPMATMGVVAAPPVAVPVVAPALQRSYHIPGYNDYAEVRLEMEDESIAGLLAATPFQLAQRCKSSDLVFPQKLHMLLTASERDPELQSIVSWKVHGRAFAVHDRKRFLKEVLPEWFLQSRFESFQRQLNLYGFARITAGPDRGACYHELFLRQKPLLATRIQRIRLKGKGPRKPAKPETEPNFYRMTLLPTYEMAKQNAYQRTMYYQNSANAAAAAAAAAAPASAAMPTPPPPPSQAPALSSNGAVNPTTTTRPTLALTAPSLPPLMPKPPSMTQSSLSTAMAPPSDASTPSGTAQIIRANPNGLCALMLRPVTRAVETVQATTLTAELAVPYKTTSSVPTGSTTAAVPVPTHVTMQPAAVTATTFMHPSTTNAAVISHPSSPAVSPVPQPPSFPVVHHRRVSTVTSSGSMQVAMASAPTSPTPVVQAPAPQLTFPHVPAAASLTTAPAPATLQPRAPAAQVQVQVTTLQPQPQQPVPRCVSQNTLAGPEPQPQEPSCCVSCDDPLTAAAAKVGSNFLPAGTEVALAALTAAAVAEGHGPISPAASTTTTDAETSANDEDFAHILFELAHGSTN